MMGMLAEAVLLAFVVGVVVGFLVGLISQKQSS